MDAREPVGRAHKSTPRGDGKRSARGPDPWAIRATVEINVANGSGRRYPTLDLKHNGYIESIAMDRPEKPADGSERWKVIADSATPSGDVNQSRPVKTAPFALRPYPHG